MYAALYDAFIFLSATSSVLKFCLRVLHMCVLVVRISTAKNRDKEYWIGCRWGHNRLLHQMSCTEHALLLVWLCVDHSHLYLLFLTTLQPQVAFLILDIHSPLSFMFAGSWSLIITTVYIKHSCHVGPRAHVFPTCKTKKKKREKKRTANDDQITAPWNNTDG